MSPAHAHVSKASAQSKESGAAEAAKLGRAALGDAADVRILFVSVVSSLITSQNENLVHKEPLTRREVLIIVEELYNLILNVEQVKRSQPLPEEEQERHDAWWAC